MASTKVKWADLAEEPALTQTEAANIISSAFLYCKVRRLVQRWHPVKGTRHRTRHPPTNPDQSVKTYNPFGALQATPEIQPDSPRAVPPPVVRTKSCSV